MLSALSLHSRIRAVERVEPLANEHVTRVPVRVDGQTLQLETTVFRPNLPGPRPLVVFNHGSNGRLPSHHDQARERPLELAKYFVARGYLVAAPMREGFGQSEGECHFRGDHAAYGLRHARDIQATIDHFVDRGLARKDEVLVIGQSNGGIVTLGYACGQPSARAVVNVSGGVDTPRYDWRTGMVTSATRLGPLAKVPSLWLYAEDDQIFPPSISRPFFDAFHAGSPRSRLVMMPSGGHGFIGRRADEAGWGFELNRFLRELDLP